MEQDELTLDAQEENQESDLVVEETIDTEGEPQVKADDGVKLSPVEYRHFKKWEAASRSPAPKVETSQASPLNVEETVLLANGMPEELLGELKALASVRKTSLIKAQADPIFVAIKDKFEKDQKHVASSMPASRGAGSVKPKVDSTTPGLTTEQHKALWEARR